MACTDIKVFTCLWSSRAEEGGRGGLSGKNPYWQNSLAIDVFHRSVTFRNIMIDQYAPVLTFLEVKLMLPKV